MTNVLWFGAIVGVVAVMVWATLGRTLVAAASAATEVPVGPGLHLLDDPAALLEGVRLREVVRWHDDLLVGFDSAAGSWTDPDHVPSRIHSPIVADQRSVDGTLRVARGAHDPRTRRLLQNWSTRTPALVAVLSRDGTFALVDIAS